MNNRMQIDPIATHDAEKIRNLIENGEPLSTSAAQFGYTPSEAQQLLDHAKKHHHFLVDWYE